MEKEYLREYPYGSLAASVIGYTTSGNLGIGGLEDYYNDTLNGVNGREYGYLNWTVTLKKRSKNRSTERPGCRQLMSTPYPVGCGKSSKNLTMPVKMVPKKAEGKKYGGDRHEPEQWGNLCHGKLSDF